MGSPGYKSVSAFENAPIGYDEDMRFALGLASRLQIQHIQPAVIRLLLAIYGISLIPN